MFMSFMKSQDKPASRLHAIAWITLNQLREGRSTVLLVQQASAHTFMLACRPNQEKKGSNEAPAA